MKRFILYLLAFIVGIFPGFFIVFNAVFTDSNGSLFERGVTFLLVILSYMVIGGAFGYFSHGLYLKLGIVLSLPAVLILAFYSAREVKLIPLNLLYIALTLVSACLGVYGGMRVKGVNKNL